MIAVRNLRRAQEIGRVLQLILLSLIALLIDHSFGFHLRQGWRGSRIVTESSAVDQEQWIVCGAWTDEPYDVDDCDPSESLPMNAASLHGYYRKRFPEKLWTVLGLTTGLHICIMTVAIVFMANSLLLVSTYVCRRKRLSIPATDYIIRCQCPAPSDLVPATLLALVMFTLHCVLWYFYNCAAYKHNTHRKYTRQIERLQLNASLNNKFEVRLEDQFVECHIVGVGVAASLSFVSSLMYVGDCLVGGEINNRHGDLWDNTPHEEHEEDVRIPSTRSYSVKDAVSSASSKSPNPKSVEEPPSVSARVDSIGQMSRMPVEGGQVGKVSIEPEGVVVRVDTDDEAVEARKSQAKDQYGMPYDPRRKSTVLEYIHKEGGYILDEKNKDNFIRVEPGTPYQHKIPPQIQAILQKQKMMNKQQP